MAQDIATDALRRSGLSARRRHEVLTVVMEELSTVGDDAATLARPDKKYAEVLTGLCQACPADPLLAAAVWRTVVAPASSALHTIVRRARERGEVACHSGSGAVLDHLILGFLSRRSLLDGSSPSTHPRRFAKHPQPKET